MLKPLTAPVGASTRLPDLGVIRAQGPDAVKFLQGQLSNDVSKLAPDSPLLAGLHNAQGRAIALLRLMLVGPDDILAVVPRELVPVVVARLAKFVLRAKVKISDASSEWDVIGLGGGTEGPLAGVPERRLALAAAGTSADAADSPAAREAWRALDIAEGVPQVYAATSEAFVAQMLNLDVLDGIAFDKGCYTGQEVIARAHYRGKVKRRMQRFRTLAPLAAGTTALRPADAGTLNDGRSFKVVDAVMLGDGRCEFLAVAPIAGGDSDEAADHTQAATVAVEPLPLPYSLPE